MGNPANGLAHPHHSRLDGRHDLEPAMTRQIPLPDSKPPRLGDFPYERVEVACNKCGRAGRYGKAGLVDKFGADCTFLKLRRHFESTCEKSNDVTRLNEVCGVGFPDMVRWKLGREPST